MKGIRKKIENILSAATFAEEGAFEYAQAFLREGRKVLLALKEGHVDMKTLKYALNSSKRVDAALDILVVLPSHAGDDISDPLLLHFLSDLKSESIPYRLIKSSGCLKQAIIDYTSNNEEVLFTVVESENSVDEDCRDTSNRLADIWQRLECPLVVVSSGLNP